MVFARVVATAAIAAALLLIAGIGSAWAQSGYLEVCASGTNGMSTRTFTYSLEGGETFSLRGGRCSAPIELPSGPILVTQVDADAATRLVSITATPGTTVVGTRSLAYRRMAVRITEAKKTTIRFTNQALTSGTGSGAGTGSGSGSGLPSGGALGKLEICKKPIRADVADGEPPTFAGFSETFTFTIQRVTAAGTPTGGKATVKVRSGSCSMPKLVPSGDYRVTELDPGGTGVNANYEVIGIEVIPAENELRRNLAARSVDARVLFAQETTVVYENRIRRAFVKVCKEIAPGSKDFLGSRTFEFVIETDTGDPDLVSVRPGECSLPQGPYPVLNPSNGMPNHAQVTEAADPSKFVVSEIRVQQSRGVVFVECETDPASGQQTCLPRVRFELGAGVNVVHFENRAVADP